MSPETWCMGGEVGRVSLKEGCNFRVRGEEMQTVQGEIGKS